MKNAAIVASHWSGAAWPSPNGDKGDDGVSHNQNLYGDLQVAAEQVREQLAIADQIDVRTHRFRA